MLWLDGVYEEKIEPPQRKPRLHRARAPSPTDLTALAGTIAHRVCRHLVRHGWPEGEGESAFLTDDAGDDATMDALRMSSITYRIASGPHAGRKVATLQTLPADADSLEGDACPEQSRWACPEQSRRACPEQSRRACPEQSRRAGQVGGPSTLLRTGVSLHAGVAAQAHERDKLERLCRYIARPAIAEKRLSIRRHGLRAIDADPVSVRTALEHGRSRRARAD
jgi:hypothetical protein